MPADDALFRTLVDRVRDTTNQLRALRINLEGPVWHDYVEVDVRYNAIGNQPNPGQTGENSVVNRKPKRLYPRKEDPPVIHAEHSIKKGSAKGPSSAKRKKSDTSWKHDNTLVRPNHFIEKSPGSKLSKRTPSYGGSENTLNSSPMEIVHEAKRRRTKGKLTPEQAAKIAQLEKELLEAKATAEKYQKDARRQEAIAVGAKAKLSVSQNADELKNKDKMIANLTKQLAEAKKSGGKQVNGEGSGTHTVADESEELEDLRTQLKNAKRKAIELQWAKDDLEEEVRKLKKRKRNPEEDEDAA